MDSINSQKLRSKSTFRGGGGHHHHHGGNNQVHSGYGGANKFTSLQTMAQTSDHQFSSTIAGGGGLNLGFTSLQSYSNHNGHANLEFTGHAAAASNQKASQQKANLERCALLEEIEKSKIEEIK